MRWILIGLFISAMSVMLAHAGTDSWATRPDLYGPAPTQWNYGTVSGCATTTIKKTSGVLHAVVISSAPNQAWDVRDSGSGADYSGGYGTVISSFPAGASIGNYMFDVAFSSGASVVMPTAGTACMITLIYR